MLWTRVTLRIRSSSIPHYSRISPNSSHFGRITQITLRAAFSTTTSRRNDLENSKVEHSQFLSNASPHSKWNDTTQGNGTTDLEEDELKGIEEDVGKLLPTTSHLMKLILPLGHTTNSPDSSDSKKYDSPLPTVLLLHPSQPLSHVSRLILASVPHNQNASISFQSSPSASTQYARQFEWSDSTDIGDFIRDAARNSEFSIHITSDSPDSPKIISVRVPTFADRTRFLRRRLDVITRELDGMDKLKAECDREARHGARRMALGGFGMLVVYWGAVARLTFWDYGWDVMEPITYLSGLSTVICGYLWFLYQGREVSYSSVLDRSVSTRRQALYKDRGLDIDRWIELGAEKRKLVKEIKGIKEDYEQPGKDDAEEEDVESDGEESKNGGRTSPIHEPETKDKSNSDSKRS